MSPWVYWRLLGRIWKINAIMEVFTYRLANWRNNVRIKQIHTIFFSRVDSGGINKIRISNSMWQFQTQWIYVLRFSKNCGVQHKLGFFLCIWFEFSSRTGGGGYKKWTWEGKEGNDDFCVLERDFYRTKEC